MARRWDGLLNESSIISLDFLVYFIVYMVIYIHTRVYFALDYPYSDRNITARDVRIGVYRCDPSLLSKVVYRRFITLAVEQL